MKIKKNNLPVDKMMDSSSRRSRSTLNLNVSDLFVGLSYRPTSNLVASRDIFNSSGKKSPKLQPVVSNKMCNSLGMNNASIYRTIRKQESNILPNMVNALGSLANIVSIIPNYMSHINNTSSVTVVPNEGIITPEYTLKRLTRGREHLAKYLESSINILESVREKTMRDEFHSMKMEHFGVQPVNLTLNEKLIDICTISPKTRMDSLHNTKSHVQHNNVFNLTRDSEIAINATIRKIKCRECSKDIIDACNSGGIPRGVDIVEMSECQNIKIDMSENSTSEYLREEVHEKRTEVPILNNHESDENGMMTIELDESADLEIPIKKPLLPKIWRKCNMVARNRGRGRGKLQLRKSGVSQLKHRKKRLQQNFYCNIQNNSNAWVGMQLDFSEELINSCNTAISTTIGDNCQHKEVIANYNITDSYYCPAVIQTFTSPHQSKCLKKRPKFRINTLDPSPNNHASTSSNFRPQHPSQCSIDSEDSCSIIFQSESELECGDYDCNFTSSEESEHEQIDAPPNRNVRFILQPIIHVMIKWDFAYRAARIGPWEKIARDRERFRSRINCVGAVLSPILLLPHRQRIYQNRFDGPSPPCEMNWIE